MICQGLQSSGSLRPVRNKQRNCSGLTELLKTRRGSAAYGIEQTHTQRLHGRNRSPRLHTHTHTHTHSYSTYKHTHTHTTEERNSLSAILHHPHTHTHTLPISLSLTLALSSAVFMHIFTPSSSISFSNFKRTIIILIIHLIYIAPMIPRRSKRTNKNKNRKQNKTQLTIFLSFQPSIQHPSFHPSIHPSIPLSIGEPGQGRNIF